MNINKEQKRQLSKEKFKAFIKDNENDIVILPLAIFMLASLFVLIIFFVNQEAHSSINANFEKYKQEISEQVEESNKQIKNSEIQLEDFEKRISKMEEMLEKQQELKNQIRSSTVVENQTIEKIVSESSGKWEVGEILPLPDLPTNLKVWTDYRWYGIGGTPHKRMQELAWTDELGCRRYNDDYIVGLGSFYTEKLGDRFEVTLESGKVFTIITGDGKADCDTDETNMFAPCIDYDGNYSANILEFVVDTEVLPEEINAYGSLDYESIFQGNIIKLVYLGRAEGDWDSYY